MTEKLETLKPLDKKSEVSGEHATLKSKIMLALLPTVTVLVVLALLEAFSRQRLLFASLASSAFLIYLDPRHEANSVRTLVISQASAAVLGFVALAAFGAGYWAAAFAMVAIIAVMIWTDAMHPPAVSTALTFAFRDASENSLILFGIAVGCVCLLVALQKISLRLLPARSEARG